MTSTFEPPDPERFVALRLARQALQTGSGAPTILNAANEIAVQSFLDGRIGFLAITDVVEQTLSAIPAPALASIDAVVELDRQARTVARTIADRLMP